MGSNRIRLGAFVRDWIHFWGIGSRNDVRVVFEMFGGSAVCGVDMRAIGRDLVLELKLKIVR